MTVESGGGSVAQGQEFRAAVRTEVRAYVGVLVVRYVPEFGHQRREFGRRSCGVRRDAGYAWRRSAFRFGGPRWRYRDAGSRGDGGRGDRGERGQVRSGGTPVLLVTVRAFLCGQVVWKQRRVDGKWRDRNDHHPGIAQDE